MSTLYHIVCSDKTALWLVSHKIICTALPEKFSDNEVFEITIFWHERVLGCGGYDFKKTKMFRHKLSIPTGNEFALYRVC